MALERRPSLLSPRLGQFYAEKPRFSGAANKTDTTKFNYLPELCPPHWRVGRRRSVRSLLKAWVGVERSGITTQRSPVLRPTMGRMKDSDDYITARAANPWTGLISPSPGAQTPRTPDSPGEALNLRRKAAQHCSPTHVVKRRPVLTKANEGREVSTVRGPSSLCNDAKSSTAPGGAADDDSFIVHMPSAREPQPFAYPGYTAEQIEALQHYQAKTRRVSSEGYDRRVFHSDSGQARALDETIEVYHTHPVCHDRPFTPYNAGYHANEEPTTPEPPTLAVRKRDYLESKISSILHKAPSGRDTAASNSGNQVPPTSSTQRSCTKSIAARDARGPASIPSNAVKHGSSSSHSRLLTKNKLHAEKYSAHDRGQEVLDPRVYTSDPALAPSTAACDSDEHVGARRAMHDHDSTDAISKCLSGPEIHTDLCHLPLVRLVRPELAAVPRAAIKNGAGGTKCSLGCDRDANSGACLRTRVGSSGSVVRAASLFERTLQTEPNVHEVDYTEPLLNCALSLLHYLGSLQVPRVGILDLLQDPEVPTKEKLDALKAMLSLAGHGLAVCTLLAMLWKLGTSLVLFVEVVLWPLVLPLRIVKWMLVR